MVYGLNDRDEVLEVSIRMRETLGLNVHQWHQPARSTSPRPEWGIDQPKMVSTAHRGCTICEADAEHRHVLTTMNPGDCRGPTVGIDDLVPDFDLRNCSEIPRSV